MEEDTLKGAVSYSVQGDETERGKVGIERQAYCVDRSMTGEGLTTIIIIIIIIII